MREVLADTYKSTASASLGVMALIISRASVCRPTVILLRITSESVALLRVIYPLAHILFAFEMRRKGGWRRGRGRGGWRTIPLPFGLPVNTHNGYVKISTPEITTDISHLTRVRCLSYTHQELLFDVNVSRK